MVSTMKGKINWLGIIMSIVLLGGITYNCYWVLTHAIEKATPTYLIGVFCILVIGLFAFIVSIAQGFYGGKK